MHGRVLSREAAQDRLGIEGPRKADERRGGFTS